jgi:hypothetical protein
MSARLVVAALRPPVLFLFVLLVPQMVFAAESIRCGMDDFGNTVCMDKNGAPIAVPADWKAGKDEATSIDGGMEGRKARTRCGIDPFGNKVCR